MPALSPFVLLGLSLRGSTVFDAASVLPDYEHLLARRVGATELERIAAAIGERYRRAGYVLVSVVVPPQRGAGGIAVLQVVEGRIERVSVEGVADGDASGRVQRIAAALRAEHPLRQATLERALLLVEDLPGMALAGPRLRPIDLAAGRHELILPLRRQRLEGALAFDNRGSRAYGPWQLWASGRVNWFDAHAAWSAQAGIFTAPFDPQEIRYGQVQLTRSIGGDGLTMRALVAGSANVAGGKLADSDTRTGSRRVSVGLSYPVLRARDVSLWSTLSADAIAATEDRQQRRFFADELRVLRLGVAGLLAEEGGRATLFSLEGSLGLDAFGASGAGALRSRPRADGRFAKLRADLSHVEPLLGALSLELRGGGQIADGAVFAAEEFDLGGARYGRAFEPGVLSGDRALAGGVELRYADPLTIAPFDRIELFGFVDGGVAWLSGTGGRVRDHLSSAGLGMRGRAGAWRAGLELGQPLDSSVGALRRQGPRLYFSIGTEF